MTCTTTPLFAESVTREIDALAAALGQQASAAATEALAFHRQLTGGPPRGDELQRLLGRSVQAAVARAFGPAALRPLLRKLEGDLPYDSDGLRERLANAGAHPVEDDLLYVVLYGLRNGLTDADVALLGPGPVRFAFELDADLTAARLSDVTLAGGALTTQRDSPAVRQADGRLTLKDIEAAAVEAASKAAVELAWDAIVACLKRIFAGAGPETAEQMLRKARAKLDEEASELAKDGASDRLRKLRELIEQIDKAIRAIQELPPAPKPAAK
jgi:hypothetical protein